MWCGKYVAEACISGQVVEFQVNEHCCVTERNCEVQKFYRSVSGTQHGTLIVASNRRVAIKTAPHGRCLVLPIGTELEIRERAVKILATTHLAVLNLRAMRLIVRLVNSSCRFRESTLCVPAPQFVYVVIL